MESKYQLELFTLLFVIYLTLYVILFHYLSILAIPKYKLKRIICPTSQIFNLLPRAILPRRNYHDLKLQSVYKSTLKTHFLKTAYCI